MFLEKLSSSLKKLSAWAGWRRKPAVDNSAGAEAQALAKALIQQRSRANLAGASPRAVAGDLRPSAAERAVHTKAERSNHFSITIRANGQEHTYDTTSGISDELANKLMDELGLPPEEFQTLVRLRQHRLEEMTATTAKDNTGLTRCPICKNQQAAPGVCPRCDPRRTLARR